MPSNIDFDLARNRRQRHAPFFPGCEALADGFRDVRFSFSFRAALAYTPGYGRALRDINAVLVLIDADYKLHSFILGRIAFTVVRPSANQIVHPRLKRC